MLIYKNKVYDNQQQQQRVIIFIERIFIFYTNFFNYLKYTLQKYCRLGPKNQKITMKNYQIYNIGHEDAEIQCSGGQNAFYLCDDQKCKNESFICHDIDCICRNQHSNCKNVYVKLLYRQYLTRKIWEKISPYQDFQNQIKKNSEKVLFKFKETVNLMSNAYCLQQARYTSLSDQQSKYLEAVKKGITQNCTGQFISKVYEYSDKSHPNKSAIQKLQSEMGQLFQKMENKLIEFQKDFIQSYQLMGKQLMLKSKIIQYQEQQQRIIKYFEDQKQKIKRIVLLYRGSQHDFSAHKFHEHCDGHQNTLVIYQSDFGTKSGGFTPSAWDSSGENRSDLSGKSFLFSLTNDRKFISKSTENTIFCGQGYGPCFGQGPDLQISDFCNSNSYSHSYINTSYYDENNPLSESDKLRIMTGNPYGEHKFSIKEIQIYKIYFY